MQLKPLLFESLTNFRLSDSLKTPFSSITEFSIFQVFESISNFTIGKPAGGGGGKQLVKRINLHGTYRYVNTSKPIRKAISL